MFNFSQENKDEILFGTSSTNKILCPLLTVCTI